MAEIGLRFRMLVKDVMSSPAVTTPENTSVDKTAQMMSDDKLGCIVVTSKDGKRSCDASFGKKPKTKQINCEGSHVNTVDHCRPR